MLVPAFLFFAAVTIRADGAPLREGCSTEDAVVVNLQAGAPVELRFVLNDGSDCYKVAAKVGDKSVVGYISGSLLSGLDSFERERREAADGSSVQQTSPVRTLQRAVASRSGDPALQKANQLLDANRPGQALAILEPLLKQKPADPDALFLAGLAAYRSDQIRPALDYWKQALDLRADPALSGLYQRVQRESANDRSSSRLYGLRVALRYEGESVRADVAQNMVSMLDQEVTRVASQLGCESGERLVAILQSRQAYLKTTDAAEWSGGQYDGRIHVSLPPSGQLSGAEMHRVVSHEVVHACLANIPGQWPSWLHEGLAQKLSGEELTPASLAQIQQMVATHSIPRLENIAQSWSRMSAAHAHVAYSVALAAVNLLFENYASYGIRNILTNPEQLPSITADLDRRLGL